MIAFYRTVNDCETSCVLSRSRFLTFVRRVNDEASALQKLSQLRKKYHDATHVCYAYRLGEQADVVKFSDAGEPQGTAGAPILEALKSAGVTFSLIAVVRYFGGIKLGAGGLTRAYGGCAGEALSAGGTTAFKLCKRYRVQTEYALYKLFTAAAQKRGAVVRDACFSDRAEFTLVCFENAEDTLLALENLNRGKLRATALPDAYEEVQG